MPKRREGSVAITTENATDWVARAEDLRGEIERLADSTEQRRTLDPEAVELLRDAGLFSIAAPSAVGGAELDLVTQTKVFEALCAADGSTGWCLLIGSTSIGLLSTYLPDEAIEEVFDGPHFPIAAGSLQPTGRAEREDGGYRVNGRWKFGSGILHSQWVLANTVIHKDGKPETTAEGFPHILTVALPQHLVTTYPETWDVEGLRGSGSCDYSIDDTFISEKFCFSAPEVGRQRGGDWYSLPVRTLVAPSHHGAALGLARRALEEITTLAVDRTRMFTTSTIAQRGAFQRDLGRADAQYRSARLLAFDALRAPLAAAVEGAPAATISVLDVESRLACAYVTDLAADVVTFAYRAGGGSSLYTSSKLERCFRDIHAATQHGMVSDSAYEQAGQVRLAIRPTSLL